MVEKGGRIISSPTGGGTMCADGAKGAEGVRMVWWYNERRRSVGAEGGRIYARRSLDDIQRVALI